MASSSNNDSSNSVTYLSLPDLRAEKPTSDCGTTKYDVFLSFYGKDARYKFTSHLYAALTRYGIPTFMDNPELPTGDVIDDALEQAINDSKIYVVVFSKDYAYSPWCLNELLQIYNMKRLIIGVYCDIDPAVVRHQTDSFAKAFKKHEEGRYKDRKDLVNKWRTALRNVAKLSGKPIPSQRSEAAVIDEIMDVVLLKTNPKSLPIARYPVGLKSALEIIMPSLSSDKQDGVIIFGLYGMRGVGKTTLAKAIYNQLLRGKFKTNSSFLAEVRDNVLKKGLASLQEQLINDILKSKQNYVKVPDRDQGIALIDAWICSTKMLVVIDDLDNKIHFESLVRSFASGSIVIITTTSQKVLDDIKVELQYRHMVNKLDGTHSRALFTKYAFEDAQVNNSLMESFSDDILRLADDLPLALEVFGSYLSTEKFHVGWESYIEKLQRNPDYTIQQKLLISLNAVALEDPMLKQLFLDIACFFIRSKKEEAVEILKTYDSFADHKIDILEKRCLLTLNSNDELRMHDLLRDMGREVARNEFRHNQPQNHSRLWMSEDISKVLTNKTGTEAIECIIQDDLIDLEYYESEEELFSADTSLSFTMETFTRMTNLRFLHLQGGAVSGNFITTFGDLKWLRWDFCPITYIPSEFYPQNIVILELLHSKITKWESKMVFKKLKAIDMSSSVHLVSTPEFNMFPCLETLHLQDCKSLKEFCIPAGSLESLVSLNLGGCSSLKQLPDNLGNLTSLKKLNARNLNVSKVPTSIGNLNKLVELSLDNNKKLKTLPDTICNLRALESLSIVACSNLEELPTDLGDIKSLTKLDVGNNKKLKSLPDSICNLKALEFLCINSCTDLKELPKELGNMKSLKVLSAKWLSITGLPDSVGSLQKLVELYLSNNRELARLPDNICKLRALEIMQIDDCRSLKSLPKELGKIESMRVLGAEFLKVEELPNSIGYLNKLVELKLYGNSELTTLPNTISNLSSLEILNLSDCEEVNILPNELWELPSLRELYAFKTTHLKMLPEIEPRQIPALPLMKLGLSGSGLTVLPRGLSQLSKLEDLDLSDCFDLVSIPELPPNLKSISTHDCKSLEMLPNVSDLKQLERLRLRNCSGLMEIQGLEELTSLRELDLGGCNLSLPGNTLTRRCFQLWSGFGDEIQIHTPSAYLPEWISESPYWISGSSHEIMLLELLPNEPHNFLGIIVCFKHIGDDQSYQTTYSVKNTKSDFVWSSSFYKGNNEAQIMIVPASIFSVRDDERIEVTANQEIYGICLLYKTDSAPSPSSIDSAPSPVAGSPLSPSPTQILSPPAAPALSLSNDSNPAKSSPSPTVEKAANYKYTEPKKSSGGNRVGVAFGVIAAALVVIFGGAVYKKRRDNIRLSRRYSAGHIQLR